MSQTLWECTVCGWDNTAPLCELCQAPQDPQSEAHAAAQLIYAAEIEFSEAMGMSISLRIIGGQPIQTIAIAQEIIAETRAHIQEHLHPEPECRGFHLVFRNAA